jgi:Kef-type K+ transport system membrane component KefB
MNDYQVGHVLFAVLLLMVGANLLGRLFSRFRQPKVVGEILAGILLGPTLLGHVAPDFTANVFGTGKDPEKVVLGFLYSFGMLMLMFVAGCAAKRLLGSENRKPTAWILAMGTPLPFFIALGVAPLLPLDHFTGVAGSQKAVILVFAAAAAVTSIPVISKIFSDLGILHTRFASLMLGSAILEDIALWGVLSVATAIASATLNAKEGDLTSAIGQHIAINAAFIFVALAIMPAVLRKLSRARWNTLAEQSPVVWMMATFTGYVALAAALNVTIAFAALLAGFGIMGGMKGTEQARFRAPLHTISEMAQNVFIPIYFAFVGYKLDLLKTLSPVMLVAFLLGTSIVAFSTAALGAKLAGMSNLDCLNIAFTENARGGPGIVMATVAFDAGIINAAFFTTLVLTAILTSQACGFWLDWVVRSGRPLLSGDDLRKRGIEPAADEELPRITPSDLPAARTGELVS